MATKKAIKKAATKQTAPKAVASTPSGIAVGEYVIIVPDTRGQSKSAAGIILPSNDEECGRVVAMSKLAAEELPEVKVGSRVSYDQRYAHKTSIGNVRYDVAKFTGIYLVVEE